MLAFTASSVGVRSQVVEVKKKKAVGRRGRGMMRKGPGNIMSMYRVVFFLCFFHSKG